MPVRSRRNCCKYVIWVIFLKTGPKRVPLSQWNKKTNLKHKTFQLPLRFWCNVFGEMREMPQCVNASLFLVLHVFFGTNHNMYIFMAVICDMANGRLADCRYFLVSVHDWIKTDFMTNKVASSYTKVIFIVCCFLLKTPNNKKLISVPHITDGVFSVCIILWLVHNRH